MKWSEVYIQVGIRGKARTLNDPQFKRQSCLFTAELLILWSVLDRDLQSDVGIFHMGNFS